MKVEIWHPGGDGSYHKVSTLDLASVNDETTCELAYIHTSDSSITQPQGIRGSKADDIFVLLDDGPDSPPRSYRLVKDTVAAVGVVFNRVQFDR